jgi:hypothetical protein
VGGSLPTVDEVETYIVFRRSGWQTTERLRASAACSREQSEQMADTVAWLRSYVVAELDGSVGSVCVFRAASPEAIRAHAERAELPVDEIVAVAETFVVRADPEPAVIRREE